MILHWLDTSLPLFAKKRILFCHQKIFNRIQITYSSIFTSKQYIITTVNITHTDHIIKKFY